MGTNYKKLKRLVISCGGTGGHFYPGLSIARTFMENGGEVTLFLCGKNSPAQAEIAARYNIKSDVSKCQVSYFLTLKPLIVSML